jgi:hypothetical protein
MCYIYIDSVMCSGHFHEQNNVSHGPSQFQMEVKSM